MQTKLTKKYLIESGNLKNSILTHCCIIVDIPVWKNFYFFKKESTLKKCIIEQTEMLIIKSRKWESL